MSLVQNFAFPKRTVGASGAPTKGGAGHLDIVRMQKKVSRSPSLIKVAVLTQPSDFIFSAHKASLCKRLEAPKVKATLKEQKLQASVLPALAMLSVWHWLRSIPLLFRRLDEWGSSDG
jgi:hypothetical protein